MKKTLLNIVLYLISVSINAQNQENFTDIVKNYKNEIESVMTMVAPINIKKEAREAISRNKDAVELYEKEAYCSITFGELFIAGGEKYRIGQNPSENVTMTISFINSKGKRKTQKKKVQDAVDYLCNKEIHADSIKVTSIQVFKIYDIAESDKHTGVFKKNILSIDGYSIFDIDEDGCISEKNETPCNFTILHTDDLSSWQVKYNINKFGASPLFGNIDVTIWTKE